jgi:hypothetical protein
MSIVIDRTLNYGRHHVRNFLRSAAPYHTVLDVGAGGGEDLMLAREVQPDAQLNAIEVHWKSHEYYARVGH